MNILFDVCNDYALSPSNEEMPSKGEYRREKYGSGIVFIHRRFNEVHYFFGPEEMNGKIITWEVGEL